MSDLHYMTATEAIASFKERSLSPVELLDAVIERAEAVEPTVNAFNEILYEEARTAAREAEDRYAANAPAPPRPLEGIPVAVKAEEPMAGCLWTFASVALKGERAEHTSPWIARLQDAGAVVHARTTLPEFAMSYFTHSAIDGVTRNPWNLDYTPGGSSGGSAAALAAGSTTLATGSDVAGSIRVPSAFCGLIGFKPPYGRVPMWAPFNLDTYCHVGPMARSVADALLMQNVAAGPHPADSTTVRPKYVIEEPLEDVRGMRIALSIDLGGSWPVDDEIRANTLAAAEVLRAAGATVEEVDLTIDREDVKRASARHYAPLFDWIDTTMAEKGTEPTAYVTKIAAVLRERSADLEEIVALEIETSISERINLLLEDYDALICPTLGTSGFRAGDDYVDHGVEVAGETVDFYWDAAMTVPFNINSRCPVLNVPTGMLHNGLPSGLQIVARTFDDVQTFRVGAALERELRLFAVSDRRPMLDLAVAGA
jgi:aspartyl-tRNA(Asn)/glutamyl-tRNA(Gln) amidotransferase subunit A